MSAERKHAYRSGWRFAAYAGRVQHDPAGHDPSGDAYTFRELAEMKTRAGFKDISSHPIPMRSHTIVMGRT